MTYWQDIEKQYYMQVVRRQPVTIVKGSGTSVWDDKGIEYLDFTAGWGVNNIGHCHPEIVKAVQTQAATLMQTSNAFYSIPQLELAQTLIDNSSMDRVFFANSGAEANEGAVKLARKYGKLHRNGAYEVITALNSFHGRTLGMIAATGQPKYQAEWNPLAPGFLNVEYDNLDAIKKATTENTCAVMLEPVQSEGGVNIPQDGYLSAVQDWCKKNGLLLILDEIATGLGRLGTLFGYQTFDVDPDIITLAKALGGGAPIGAFLAKEHASVLEPGDHGSTFGGNMLACAAANASTKYIIEHDIPAQGKLAGEHLKAGLKEIQSRHEYITDVRGVGLLLAMSFDDDLSSRIVSSCVKEGLLLNAVRPNAIRIWPPLTISAKEIDQGLERLERGMHAAMEQ
jgi:acetylornithine/N-succinyldiaminopimelate aminotransferase